MQVQSRFPRISVPDGLRVVVETHTETGRAKYVYAKVVHLQSQKALRSFGGQCCRATGRKAADPLRELRAWLTNVADALPAVDWTRDEAAVVADPAALAIAETV
jgi:predicted RNA-binding protein YlxR (DUF448 family)